MSFLLHHFTSKRNQILTWKYHVEEFMAIIFIENQFTLDAVVDVNWTELGCNSSNFNVFANLTTNSQNNLEIFDITFTTIL